MSLKTISSRVTGKVGRQVLVAQKHSPAMLFGVGLLGVGTSLVLACRATLKLTDVLSEAEAVAKKINDELTDKGAISSEHPNGDEWMERTLGVKLRLAIKVAGLYAPTAVVLVGSVAAMTGAQFIMHKRNAGLAAAYAIIDKGFKDYRKRVLEDQGAEKDLEYRWGVTEREIVKEGPNGPEVTTIKGLDQDAIRASENSMYARIFAHGNPNWHDVGTENAYFVQSMQNHANELLQREGRVFLTTVYELLGFDPTIASQTVGWLKHSKNGDGFIDFGVWDQGVFRGKEWVTGNATGILLDFNVDGVILNELERA